MQQIKNWQMVTLVASLALGMAGVTRAQQPDAQRRSPSPAEMWGRLFQSFDKDGDGQVQEQELSPIIWERLGPARDRLGKDSLTEEEFVEAMQSMNPGVRVRENRPHQRLGELLQRLDQNQDGLLSRDEIPAAERERLAPLFDRLQTDSIDINRLSGFAQERSRSDRSSLERDWRGDRGPGRGPRSRGDSRSARQSVAAFIQVLDVDQNGAISQAEMLNAGRLYAELDLNRDGELDAEELAGSAPAAPEAAVSESEADSATPVKESTPPEREEPPTREPLPEAGETETPSTEPGSADVPKPQESTAAAEISELRLNLGLGHSAESLFARLDRNGDEAFDDADDSALGPQFRSMDTNGDGKVTLAEMKAGLTQARDRWFAAHDQNQDQVLTAEDGGDPRVLKVLMSLDADQNGQVSREEFIAETTTAASATVDQKPAETLILKGLPPDRAPGGDLPKLQVRSPQPGDAIPLDESQQRRKDVLDRFFGRVDTNADGFVDEDEITPSLKADMDQIDLDGDGKLNAAEFRARFEGRLGNSSVEIKNRPATEKSEEAPEEDATPRE